MIIGIMGASKGIQLESPTHAELLKPEGSPTAQNGKNYLGN
jgi:arylsulfatase A-like enzyme